MPVPNFSFFVQFFSPQFFKPVLNRPVYRSTKHGSINVVIQMFGWLFPKSRIRAVAQVIHEMASHSLHLRDQFGRDPAGYFALNPLVISERTIGPEGTRIFHMASDALSLDVMISKPTDAGKSIVAFAPQGDFAGAIIQATQVGVYVAGVDRTLPAGKLADRLVAEFVARYNASDMTGELARSPPGS